MTQRRARLGVMGGTFDPIHHGHLVAASEVAAQYDLDEVVFVPTGAPSFKQDVDVTPAEHRYLMTVIATASNPRFTVSRVDIDRPGLTYTVDTLRDLAHERPDADLYFITGADAIEQILTWKDSPELFQRAQFAHQAVIFGVRYLGRVHNMVEVLVMAQRGAQFGDLVLNGFHIAPSDKKPPAGGGLVNQN